MNECKPAKSRVKVMPCGGQIILSFDDGRDPLSLSPADALNSGSCLAHECLRASATGRLANPAVAALHLPPCPPREGFLIAERLLLLACRVGMAWSQTAILGPDTEDDDEEEEENEPDDDDQGEPVAELLDADLTSVGA